MKYKLYKNIKCPVCWVIMTNYEYERHDCPRSYKS